MQYKMQRQHTKKLKKAARQAEKESKKAEEATLGNTAAYRAKRRARA